MGAQIRVPVLVQKQDLRRTGAPTGFLMRKATSASSLVRQRCSALAGVPARVDAPLEPIRDRRGAARPPARCRFAWVAHDAREYLVARAKNDRSREGVAKRLLVLRSGISSGREESGRRSPAGLFSPAPLCISESILSSLSGFG